MSEDQANDNGNAEETQPERSQFSRRLASFGLGETPDPLLTRVPPPSAPGPGVQKDGPSPLRRS